MFEQKLTVGQYEHLSDSRASQTRQLIIQALESQLPAGYAISLHPEKMYGNALLAVRPVTPEVGSRMICFMHAINYRSDRGADDARYVPTCEIVRACGDIKRQSAWETDAGFGEEGAIAITNVGGTSLADMVSKVVAEACTQAPFVNFEWRKCPHDQYGKWELFGGERRLQTVWKSGSKYATLMGTCPRTLDQAKAEAEAAARLMLRSEHSERLANLGDEPADDSVMEDQPTASLAA